MNKSDNALTKVMSVTQVMDVVGFQSCGRSEGVVGNSNVEHVCEGKGKGT